VATLEPLTDLLDQTLRPLPQKIRETRFAFLDQDAERFARFLIDQLPALPQGDPQASAPADRGS
jgi:hypothetical protein